MIWTVNGACPCGGAYEDRWVEVRLVAPSSGHETLLQSIPQGVCPVCGSRVYHASDLNRIELVFREIRQD